MRMENIIFRKSISFDRKIKALTQKLFYVSIFTSNHFQTQTRKERERERESLTSRNQTRRRDHTPTPDASMRSCHWDRLAEIAPHEAYHRLTSPVLLWVRSSPPLGWSRRLPLADLSPPLGRSHRRSAFSLWSLIFFFFWLLLLWWRFGGFYVVWWWIFCGCWCVGGGGFCDIKFVWKLRKWLRKCEKFVRK